DLDSPRAGEGALEVSGMATSSGWKSALDAARDSKIPWKIPSEDSLVSPSLVFARQGIPSITVYGDMGLVQGQEPGKTSVREIRQLFKLVQAAGSPGKLSYHPPAR
ncbi:MAG TPA: hypothetical protein VMV20_01285, partial [Chitinophagaceae bacterium]|nr:hypothetical protein [Chitinophagaceae bacterium]